MQRHETKQFGNCSFHLQLGWVELPGGCSPESPQLCGIGESGEGKLPFTRTFRLDLKAFELGADGVMLLGCRPGSCHFEKDENTTVREFDKAVSLLGLLGLGANKMRLTRIPRGDGDAFVNEVERFLVEVSQAG